MCPYAKELLESKQHEQVDCSAQTAEAQWLLKSLSTLSDLVGEFNEKFSNLQKMAPPQSKFVEDRRRVSEGRV